MPRCVPLTAAECLKSTATPWGSSRWAVHNRCAREYDLKYNKGIYRLRRKDETAISAAPNKPNALRIGTIVHACIRLVETSNYASAEAVNAVADAAALQPLIFSVFDIAEGVRIASAYWAHWGEENALAPGWPEGLAIVETELQLAAAGLKHTGAIDTLLQDESGSYVIVDTKTRASKLPEDAARLYATNPQFLSLSYMLQEKLDLSDPPPLMLNAAIKTKIPSFDRRLIRFRQSQVDEWARNQQLIEQRGEQLKEFGAPRNYSQCAPTIGSPCEFFDYCEAPSDEARALKYAQGEGFAEEAEAAE